MCICEQIGMMDSFRLSGGFFAFYLGACIASFLNVVIWRVPRGESIVSPPSHCPKCNTPIRWFQNIPILSWLALRGKCAKCKASISPRYILVETLGGCLFLFSFLHIFSMSLPFQEFFGWWNFVQVFVLWIWFSLMIVGSFIDFDHQLLPDFTTVGGMILGVLNAAVFSFYLKSWNPIFASLIGLVFGFGLLWLIRFFGTLALKREAMGLGDVFLIGAIGAISGWQGVLVSLIIASFVGSIAGIALMLFAKIRFGKFVAIPFGPYLCIGSIAHIFFGGEIICWYLKLLNIGA